MPVAAGKRPVGRPRADGKPHISRRAVFSVATKLIARKGYAGTSLRMIADELDVQAPSILNLFKTKERLLIELVVELSQASLNFYKKLEAENFAPDVSLYKMILEEARAVTGASHDVSSIFYLPELRYPQFKEAQDQRARMIASYREQLDRGIAAGKFRDMNTEQLAEQVFQLTETAIIALHPKKLGNPDVQARSTANFVLRSLLVKPGRLPSIESKALACDLAITGV